METRIILREAAAGGEGATISGTRPHMPDSWRTQGDGPQETDPEHNYSSHPVRGSDVFDDQRWDAEKGVLAGHG